MTTDPNQADIAFMQMMVPHHAQAVEMAELARRHAVDPGVRRLAARIRAAQGPEIVSMSAWLEEHGIPAAPEDGLSGHHGGSAQMMGMLTPAEMDALAAARGREFDRLFLEGMIGHHQGALRMANTVAVKGIDVRVLELAGDVSLTQNAEIAQLRQLLGSAACQKSLCASRTHGTHLASLESLELTRQSGAPPPRDAPTLGAPTRSTLTRH